jgi:signal transduction histidine kinase
LNNIGDVYFHFHDNEKALQFYLNALKIREQKQDNRGIAISSLNIGQLYMAENKLAKAEPYLKKAVELSYKINEGELMKEAGYDNFRYYKKLGDSEKALEYMLIYSAQKDSILNREKTCKIADLQIRLELNKKNIEIDRLKREKEVSEVEVKYQKMLVVILLISFLIVVFFAVQLYVSLKNKKRSNQILERIFSVVAHDLRNPVSILGGLSTLLSQQVIKLSYDEQSLLLKQMDGISKSTISLLDNLLEWSKQQHGVISYNPEKVNVNYVLEENLLLLKIIAKNKNIELQNYTMPDINVFADKRALSIVFVNLIVNAIKFSYAG